MSESRRRYAPTLGTGGGGAPIDYLDRQQAADRANWEASRAGEAGRADAAQVKPLADHLLGVIFDANHPAMPAHVWRAAVQQVYERLGEVVRESI